MAKSDDIAALGPISDAIGKAAAERRTPRDQESLIEVEFTVLGNTDLDRFDILLDRFIDDDIEDDAELNEFRDMIVYARRLDGKD